MIVANTTFEEIYARAAVAYREQHSLSSAQTNAHDLHLEICSVLPLAIPEYMRFGHGGSLNLRDHGCDFTPMAASALKIASELQEAHVGGVELIWPKPGLIADSSTMEFRSTAGQPLGEAPVFGKLPKVLFSISPAMVLSISRWILLARLR
jgi:hypothetical protein